MQSYFKNYIIVSFIGLTLAQAEICKELSNDNEMNFDLCEKIVIHTMKSQTSNGFWKLLCAITISVCFGVIQFYYDWNKQLLTVTNVKFPQIEGEIKTESPRTKGDEVKEETTCEEKNNEEEETSEDLKEETSEDLKKEEIKPVEPVKKVVEQQDSFSLVEEVSVEIERRETDRDEIQGEIPRDLPRMNFQDLPQQLGPLRIRARSAPVSMQDKMRSFQGEKTPELSPHLESFPDAILEPAEMQLPEHLEPGSSIEENWEVHQQEDPKVNERKPMVFIGGISASTSPMDLVVELKRQGFNVTVVPRIRYGVSFGFCPDLVVSSGEEVARLLAIRRIWIKDRWCDVRPYVAKDDTTPQNSPPPRESPPMTQGQSEMQEFIPYEDQNGNQSPFVQFFQPHMQQMQMMHPLQFAVLNNQDLNQTPTPFVPNQEPMKQFVTIQSSNDFLLPQMYMPAECQFSPMVQPQQHPVSFPCVSMEMAHHNSNSSNDELRSC